MIKLLIRAKLIYDLHEGYFSQAYEYSGKTIRGFLIGLRRRIAEYLLIRLPDIAFHIDEYLYVLYPQRGFSSKKLYIFRNFVNLRLISNIHEPKATEGLKLGPQVEFLGELPHKEVMDYMAIADIFSLPSWQEGFGMVYLEAMAHGRPVIACEGEGIADVIEGRW